MAFNCRKPGGANVSAPFAEAGAILSSRVRPRHRSDQRRCGRTAGSASRFRFDFTSQMIREYTRSMTANIQKNTASNLKSKRFLLLILMLIGCGTFALQT